MIPEFQALLVFPGVPHVIRAAPSEVSRGYRSERVALFRLAE